VCQRQEGDKQWIRTPTTCVTYPLFLPHNNLLWIGWWWRWWWYISWTHDLICKSILCSVVYSRIMSWSFWAVKRRATLKALLWIASSTMIVFTSDQLCVLKSRLMGSW
jgi:hypothetical protein